MNNTNKKQRWLVTGVAGFIGSHILEKLINMDQEVVGIDNLSTGSETNLETVKNRVGIDKFSKLFSFHKGDITNLEFCKKSVAGCDLVLHQAALGSVPRSIEDPLNSHNSNVDGFVNMALAARDAGLKRFVYASSSSVYGDSQALPKKEGQEGRVLSPYALTKRINEEYAEVFSLHYGMEFVGLRYFNVFGPRQNPDGPYAAVIPRWLQAVKNSEAINIFGDGSFSRDFCYVENAVKANILAATVDLKGEKSPVFNTSCGEQTNLNELWNLITQYAEELGIKSYIREPQYSAQRVGDVPHSLGDISRAKSILGYSPSHYFKEGLKETVREYLFIGE